MSSSVLPEPSPSVTHLARFRTRALGATRWIMEILVLALVSLSPWAFGAVEPMFESLLAAGVALVAGLWAVRILLAGQLRLAKCPVTLGLFGLVLLALWQLKPMPESVLASVSPGAVQLYHQFLPAQPEKVPGDEPHLNVSPPPGSTISLYPTATRQELFRLLAVLLLFAAIRNNLAEPAALRRLGFVAFSNGVLLALFALFQFFQSPDHMVIYGSYATQGQVFGPFICRNHFPFYVNICIGLGLGLLLRPPAAATVSRPSRSRHRRTAPERRPDEPGAAPPPTASHRSTARENRRSERRPSTPASDNPLTHLLNNPRRLWICLGLALMLSSVAVSLSRGGMVALLGGVVVFVAIQMVRVPRLSRLAPLLLTLLVGFGLVAWFGFGFIETRLATLWKGQALEGRMPVWKYCLPLVKDFPVLGTGYGTFQYVEMLQRRSGSDPDTVFTHAHNEYLEALVEGGAGRLLLTLALIFLVYRQAFRGLRRYRDASVSGWLLGGVVGLTTAVVHSFVDFGLHIPAITVLVTVLAAYVCGLGSDATGRESGSYSLRLFGLAPLAAGVVLVLAALGLAEEAWKAHVVQLCRINAGSKEPVERERQIELLNYTAAQAPGYARLQFELSEVYFASYDAGVARLNDRNRAIELAQLVLAPLGHGQAALGMVSAVGALPPAQVARFGQEEQELARRYLEPALRHCLAARDLCPLVSRPHLRLAVHANRLTQGDARSVYLDRAKLLASTDPDLWFYAGMDDFLRGNPEAACASWRRSLELSDRYLAHILALAGKKLSAEDLIDKTLPAKAEVLIAAANQLHPAAEAAPERAPFLEKALDALETQPPPLKAEDLHLKGVLLGTLARLPEAQAAYQAALLQQPRHIQWRLELAQLLYQGRQFKEARRELGTVLAQDPKNAGAQNLLNQVERMIAREL